MDDRDALTPHPPLAGGRKQVHLTGFMASGKTTVGKLLARRLLWNFLDLDGVVERLAGRTVAEIFEEGGEGEFRRLERLAFRQVVDKPSTVVALGGGTLLDPRNRELSSSRGVLVWLRCSLDVLRRRRGARERDARIRPLWSGGEDLEALYEARRPGYREADLIVDAARSPEEVTEEILERLEVGR